MEVGTPRSIRMVTTPCTTKWCLHGLRLALQPDADCIFPAEGGNTMPVSRFIPRLSFIILLVVAFGIGFAVRLLMLHAYAEAESRSARGIVVQYFDALSKHDYIKASSIATFSKIPKDQELAFLKTAERVNPLLSFQIKSVRVYTSNLAIVTVSSQLKGINKDRPEISEVETLKKGLKWTCYFND